MIFSFNGETGCIKGSCSSFRVKRKDVKLDKSVIEKNITEK